MLRLEIDPSAEAECILLVDDDPTNLQVLVQTLKGGGYKLVTAKSGEAGLEVARRARPRLILLDVMMPGIDGYETCRQLKADDSTRDAAVIFLSALDEAGDKVRGFECGAVDFITKPFQSEEVTARVDMHLETDRLRRELELRNDALAHELRVAEQLLVDARRRVQAALLGDSAAVRALREAIASNAGSAETLLLMGQPGAGQEAVARAIHHESDRSSRAFIHVNCSRLEAEHLDSLWPTPGSGAGNRTEGGGGTGGGSGDGGVADGGGGPGDAGGADGGGSSAEKLGKLDLAAGGTLYLESVDQLPQSLQESLAAVLAQLEAQRDGAPGPLPDVRVIAYSREDLIDRVQQGRYHHKLAELVSYNVLHVPSLVERKDDVPLLVEHFVQQHSQRLGSLVEGVSEDSMRRLRRYRWPGNIAELESLVERAVVTAREPLIEIDRALLEEGLPLGHYRLLEKIGQGGMGEVWLAKHQMLARPAAIKLIHPEALQQEDRQSIRERFRREARATAALSSPHTVELYDFGVSESGAFYYVMERLRGLDLASMLKRFGRLEPERCIMFLRQACRSLSEAHQAGLVHRDIKPANLFACKLGDEYDFLKVLDFGIVKDVATEEHTNLTQTGTLTGTPAIMAPEAVLGKEVGHAADLYSLGCVAWNLLTDRTVFDGEPIKVLTDHVRTEPEPPSRYVETEIPEDLEELIMLCLRKEPEQRPDSARALGEMLDNVEPPRQWTPARAETWWRDHLSGPTQTVQEGDDDPSPLIAVDVGG